MRRRRVLIASAATVAALAPPAWMRATSLVPDTSTPTEMGYADYGGGPSHGRTWRHDG